MSITITVIDIEKHLVFWRKRILCIGCDWKLHCRMALVVLLLSLCSAVVDAHEFRVNQARVDISEPDTVRVLLELDILDLWGGQFSEDAKNDLERSIEAMQQLSLGDLVDRRKLLMAELDADTKLLFDGLNANLEPFQALSALKMYQLVQRGAVDTNFRLKFRAQGTFLPGSQEIRAGFPESLGLVSLSIYKPRMLLVREGELSYGHLFGSNGIRAYGGQLANAFDYLIQGFIHVVPAKNWSVGWDHLLFVIALVLMLPKLSVLFWQITAFTAAHTLTLGLSAAGWISLSSQVVEPLIALSIVWVAVENIYFRKLRWHRILVVFLFGLIHGLGFASSLAAIGLPQSQWLESLFAFNMGVELAQISVVVPIFILLWFISRRFEILEKVQLVGSLAIGVVGCWWLIERVL